MQIDFHHAVTYVLARLSGFCHCEATTIAYAAQYVDDAKNRGVVVFDNGRRYLRLASSHDIFDVQNNKNVKEDCDVWVAFHFLPGNNGAKCEEGWQLPISQRLLCMPDSPVASDMLTACLATRGTANALHRLGITAHVYADTFAHQRFAGLEHPINGASSNWHGEFDLGDTLKSLVVRFVSKLGHGAVLTHPDLPFLVWQYKDGYGKNVQRDNPHEFLQCCFRLFDFFSAYRNSNHQQISPADEEVLASSLREFKSEDGGERHRQWLNLIGEGRFSFGKLDDAEQMELQYAPKGRGSWKFNAIGTDKENDASDDVFEYSPAFEQSDWKLFHDALKSHQYEVLNNILPRYQLPISVELARAARHN